MRFKSKIGKIIELTQELFYKYFANIKGGKYLAVVVKINKRNFILTSYLTDKTITGKKIYEKE